MPSPTPSTPTRRSNRGRRTASVVAGTLVGLLAFGLLTAGGALLWANGKKDDDGYLTTARHGFATRSYAIATDNLDINLDGAGTVLDSAGYGKVRVNATPQGGKPVFVGIARTDQVAQYLRHTAHATLTDIESSPFKATYRSVSGDRGPAAPGAQSFWAASTHGAGTQSLKWKVKDGSWSVVVMNADGSAGVDAGVTAGAKVPFLTAVAWGSIGGGVLLLIAAGGLVALGVRAPRPRSATLEAPEAVTA